MVKFNHVFDQIIILLIHIIWVDGFSILRVKKYHKKLKFAEYDKINNFWKS